MRTSRWPSSTLGAICAQQGRFEEALTLTERAYAIHALGESDHRTARSPAGSRRRHDPGRRVAREAPAGRSMWGARRAGRISRHVWGIRSGGGMGRTCNRRAVSAPGQDLAAAPSRSEVAGPGENDGADMKWILSTVVVTDVRVVERGDCPGFSLNSGPSGRCPARKHREGSSARCHGAVSCRVHGRPLPCRRLRSPRRFHPRRGALQQSGTQSSPWVIAVATERVPLITIRDPFRYSTSPTGSSSSPFSVPLSGSGTPDDAFLRRGRMS